MDSFITLKNCIENLSIPPNVSVLKQHSIDALSSPTTNFIEFRRLGNLLWNWIVSNINNIPKEVQAEMREIACSLVEKFPKQTDVTLMRMLGKTAKCFSEIKQFGKADSIFAKATTFYNNTLNLSLTSKDQMHLRKMGYTLFVWRMISSWDDGKMELAWMYYNKAKEILKDSNDSVEEISIILYNKSIELFSMGAFQFCIEWVTEFIELSCNNSSKLADGFQIMGNCYVELGNYEKALSAIGKSLEFEKNEKTYILQIKCYLMMDQTNEAILPFKQLIQNPDTSFDTKLLVCQITANAKSNDLTSFGYETLLTSISESTLIDSRLFFKVVYSYLSYLFQCNVINYTSSHNIVDILYNHLRSAKVILLPEESYSISSILWERGLGDVSNGNYRTAKNECLENIQELLKNICICEYHLHNYNDAIQSSTLSIEKGCKDFKPHFILFSSLLHTQNTIEANNVLKQAIEQGGDNLVSFLEGCCGVAEECNETELLLISLKELYSVLPSNSTPGTTIIVFRQLIKIGFELTYVQKLCQLIEENHELVIGNEKGDFEWCLAYFFNEGKEQYTRKQSNNCCWCFYAYNKLSKCFEAYSKLFENRLLSCLMGAASGAEGVGQEVLKQTIEMMDDAKECLEELRKNGSSVSNPLDKLEVTCCTVEVKVSLLKREGLDDVISKAFQIGMNSSVLELIGMSCIEGGNNVIGVKCLTQALEQTCKSQEFDVVRFSRIIPLSILPTVQSSYPQVEIQWLLASCWNKGNRSRRARDDNRAEQWYVTSLSLLNYLEDKKEMEK
ncbi:Protein ZIP4-like protein [Entamoeba marina]